MPTTVSNVIGFWLQKDGKVEYSVLKPTTGTGGINYNASFAKYFVAVQATTATGAVDTSIPLKLYSTSIIRVGTVDHIVVSIPLNMYPNGATVVLVQPTTVYDEINITAPVTLSYDLTAGDYTINYHASYDMPPGLHDELVLDGHANANTQFYLTLYPDFRTTIEISSFTLVSELFEIDGVPVWNAITGEFVVTLKLKNDWAITTNLGLAFEFDCNMAAADFMDGDFLRLIGDLLIDGLGQTYLVYSNEAKTEMVTLRGNLNVSKLLSGNDVDETADFHFTITFSDSNTYGGVISGSTIVLKGGEHKLITGIIQGITYTVVEQEANQYGYTTTLTDATGTISAVQSEAVFVNTRDRPSEYVVTVNDSFAGVLSGAGSYAEGDRVTIRAGNRFGYVFSNWTVNTIGVTVTLDNSNAAITSFIMPANNVTVTANWIALKYYITYILYGGNNAPGNPSMYTMDDLPLNIAEPSRVGYTFLGWTAVYTNGQPLSTNPTTSFAIPENTTGLVILHAHWHKIGGEETQWFSVTYDGNNATNGTAPTDPQNPYTTGSKVTVLGQGDLNRDGYTFLGWTIKDPTTVIVEYREGDVFTITQNTLLHAVWTEEEVILPPQTLYTVTYLPGIHGTFNPQVTAGLVYGDPTPKAPTVTSETGWTFTGWTPTPTPTVTEDATYVAQWEQAKTDNNNNSGSGTSPTKPPTNKIPPTPTPPNYTSPNPTPPDTTTPPPLQVWAIVNLMLSIVGLIFAIFVVLYVLLQKRQKRQKQQQKTAKSQNTATVHSRNEQNDEQQQRKQHRKLWLITAVIMGIAGVIVFILTEDMNNPMVLIDRWTIVNAIIFIVEIMAIIFTFKRKKKNNQNSKQEEHNPINPNNN
jgi:uncharacterized repeat protein (TIGR02543 family)